LTVLTTLTFKTGVRVPQSAIIAVAFLNAAHLLQIATPLVVTSGNDSTHMTGSKHYSDQALDFRTKTLTTGQKHALQIAVQKRLGRDYDCVLEDLGGPNEHLHVEHDAKGTP
jgi:hypothetical protein